MINFKDSKDQTPSALAALGIVLIAASVVVSVFFNRGIDAQAYASKARKDQAALGQRSLIAQSDKSIFDYAVERYEWQDKEDLVTPQALDIISKRAEENRLKLVSFRPMKSTEVSSMIQLPMQFTVDGSFANVAAMLESLEKTGSKLTVQQVQFASQEGQSDQVSANVSLFAYLVKPITPKAGSKTAKAAPTTTSLPANAGTNSTRTTVPDKNHG